MLFSHARSNRYSKTVFSRQKGEKKKSPQTPVRLRLWLWHQFQIHKPLLDKPAWICRQWTAVKKQSDEKACFLDQQFIYKFQCMCTFSHCFLSFLFSLKLIHFIWNYDVSKLSSGRNLFKIKIKYLNVNKSYYIFNYNLRLCMR